MPSLAENKLQISPYVLNSRFFGMFDESAVSQTHQFSCSFNLQHPKIQECFCLQVFGLSGSWDVKKAIRMAGWPKDLNNNTRGTKHEPWEEQMQQLQLHRKQQAQNPTVRNRTNSEKIESSSLDLEKHLLLEVNCEFPSI